MNETSTPSEHRLMLPPSVVTRIDIARLVNEMEQLDNDLISRSARQKSGVTPTKELAVSEQLSDFLSVNQLQISSESAARSTLIHQIRDLKTAAPTVHITFASSADTESLQKIVSWLRQSVHPQAVIVVGLQPSLIGGAYIRTPNRVHDFSLRAQLAGHRDIITQEVEALRGGN